MQFQQSFKKYLGLIKILGPEKNLVDKSWDQKKFRAENFLGPKFFWTILDSVILNSAILDLVNLDLAILDSAILESPIFIRWLYFKISGKYHLNWLKYGYFGKIKDGCQKSKKVVRNQTWLPDIH